MAAPSINPNRRFSMDISRNISLANIWTVVWKIGQQQKIEKKRKKEIYICRISAEYLP